MWASVRHWVSDRFAFYPVWEHVLDRRVAAGSWYFGDGAALAFLLLVQVVTGAVMGLTYSPTPEAALDSVLHITHRQTLGWFVRGLHYWSGGLMVVMLYFHLLRQILVAGYKSPREGTWTLGVLMFFLVHIMAFSGYLLRWDERAIYGLRVVLHMFERVPLIGQGLVLLVQGGPEPGAAALTRLYAVHVIIVPLLLLALAGYHMYLVIYHGTTGQTEREIPIHSARHQREVYEEDALSAERGERFHPTTAAKSGAFAMSVFALAIALTLLLGPGRLYPEANLTQRSAPIEEWWFWWYSALIALLPPWLAPTFLVAFPLLLLLLLLALPLVDRGPYRGMRHRPWAVVVVVLCVVALLYLSDLRRRSPWTGVPGTPPPPPPAGVTLSPDVEHGRLLMASYGCTSCHAVAGEGPRVATDLARMGHRYSFDELKAYILQPPPGVAMPQYAGRISDEDLDRLAGFVLVAQTFPRER